MATINTQPTTVRLFTERALVVALVLVVWEQAVTLFNIRPYLLPPFTQVMKTGWDNIGLLLQQGWVTSYEVIIGYVLAVIGGIALGLAIFASPLAYRTIYPVVVMFQGLPKIALAPLLIVWVGYGISSKVLMAFLFSFFPVVIGTLGGLAGTPSNLIEHFHAIGASSISRFVRLQLPAALPSIMDGCKNAIPLAVIGAIAGEFVGSDKGLGYIILDANAQGRTDLMFAALIAISIISGILYWFVERAAHLVWWRGL